ncbi:hypothetical protein M422DRAFT_248594 [Sphaerobolus stellatus SS14]|nr:hypothetical protein M422DRAFT_248594 [Sphaerobolus stellatus SS14]
MSRAIVQRSLVDFSISDAEVDWMKGYRQMWYLEHDEPPNLEEFDLMTRLMIKTFEWQDSLLLDKTAKKPGVDSEDEVEEATCLEVENMDLDLD